MNTAYPLLPVESCRARRGNIELSISEFECSELKSLELVAFNRCRQRQNDAAQVPVSCGDSLGPLMKSSGGWAVTIRSVRLTCQQPRFAHRDARGRSGAAPWATGNLDKRTSLAIAGNGCSIRATTPLTGLVAPRARHARVIRPPAATTARTSDKLSRTPRAVAATPTQPRICAQRCVTPTVPTMP